MRPILVGGMALIVLGSDRVTHDFDFAITLSPPDLDIVLTIFYEAGFELISRLDNRKVARTIDNPRIASMRIRLDKPESIFFYNRDIDLRVDLLIECPIPAAQLAINAQPLTIDTHTYLVASSADLLTLKQLAYQDRKFSTDLQDIEFLQKLQKLPRKRKK